MEREKAALPAPEQRQGQDEINLTEFPIALLSDRTPRGKPASLRFTSGDKVWEILGHATHGLPTRPDLEVYVVLMELTREQGFPERVRFTRHDLLQRLGWGTSAERYGRLQQALDCWVGVTIQTTNSFYDKQAGQWLHRHAFHLLDEYQIVERSAPPAPRAPAAAGAREGREEESACWFRWSETLRRNMQAHYVKSLDVELFLTFRSAVTQALYRYLDAKRLDGKPQFQQSLVELARQHLGLPASYYPSQIKRVLDRAHEELLENGFLAAVRYEPLRVAGGEKVVYFFSAPPPQLLRARAPARARSRAAKAPAQASLPATDGAGTRAAGGEVMGCGGEPNSPHHPITPSPHHPITPSPHQSMVEQLVARGMTAAIAVALAAAKREECERQLEYLPYREARNPGGVLRRAIEESWEAPEEFVAAREQQERAAGALRASRQRRAASQAAEAQAAAEAAAFDAWWAALPAPEQERLTAAARAELIGDNPVLAQHYERHPHRLFEALRPLLMRRMG
jgi:hypothetical protein